MTRAHGCPCCGGTTMVTFADRPNAACATCGALERHRALIRLTASLLARGKGRAALEAGPLNPRVFGDYLRSRDWRYESLDRWRTGNPNDPRAARFIDHEADLTNLAGFDEARFDLFIAQHVIEEVEDYQRALSEIARVLRPRGVALLEIPFDPDRPRSQRQPPDHFGNLWAFGADLPDAVRRHFARVEALDMEEGAYRGKLLLCVR